VQLVAGSDAFLGAEGGEPLLAGGRVSAEVGEDEQAAFRKQRSFKRLEAGEQA
jgi:hypothetical protein